MANLTSPRHKKRVFQSEEAPFPVPIETITKKPASDGHWFFYTGHLSANCVLVKREGDVLFLYKMGFFGKGILSKSKPQHKKFEESFQGLRRKNLPAKERKFQQQRFQQVRQHKYERHLSWQKLLQQQLSEHNRPPILTNIVPSVESSESSIKQADSPIEMADSSCVSSVTHSDQESSCQGSSHHTVGQEVEDDLRLCGSSTQEILSSSFDQEKDTNKNQVNQEKTCQIKPLKDRCERASDKGMHGELQVEDHVTQVRRREWMADSGDDIDMLTSSEIATPCDKLDTVTRTIDDVITTESEDGREELTIVIEDEGNDDKKWKHVGAQSEREKRSKGTGNRNGQTKTTVKKPDPFKIFEHLQLSFEEAFFLSFGLGCLSVLDENGTPMPLSLLWRTFCSLQANFLPNYVVYHYLRSKGWVPKAGAKYGADFVLYKKGPPFYHASYSVLVTMVDEHSSNHDDKRFWNWSAVTGMNRITENVAKEVLVCYVLKPHGILKAELATPKCLHRFQVQEVIMKRWVSSRERDSRDTEESLIS